MYKVWKYRVQNAPIILRKGKFHGIYFLMPYFNPKNKA